MFSFKNKFSLLAVMAAVVLVLGTSAFKNKSAGKTEDLRHWYIVQYDEMLYPGGAVLDGTLSYVGEYTKSEVSGICSGENKDCLRGFDSQLPEEVFTTPNTSSGAEQTLKN